jgi:hypothetical protein
LWARRPNWVGFFRVSDSLQVWTSLHFYGSAGPTLVLDSPGKGDNGIEIGLSLVAGMKIPMNKENRYNLEVRFGIGDIPDLKLMLGILFGV